MSVFDPSRRQLLIRSGALAGAAALASLPGSALLATPAYPASSHSKTPTGEEIRKAYRRFRANQARVLTGGPSPNGWEMEKATDGDGTIWSRPVPVTPLEGVTVRIGAPEAVLVHVIRRFHYEIDELRKGDVAGWRSPGTVRKGLPEGNLASGTAVRIRPATTRRASRAASSPSRRSCSATSSPSSAAWSAGAGTTGSRTSRSSTSP